MTEGAWIFVAGFVFGGPFWFYLAWNRYVRTERPKVVVKVTPEVASQLSGEMVRQWLDSRGLTWMPKGTDFRVKVKR